jgi:putative two-component system hydrogenase maturation factor HypX/HoxX
MRILILCHAFNSLTQRLYAELAAAGHELSVEFDINDAVTREAVALWQPDVVLAPYLKRAIPGDIWRSHLCLIVHPGPPGDRGPNALDHALMRADPVWGVTVLQAQAELDAGPVWAWREFPMRLARKSTLYRQEVAKAAVAAVFEALERVQSPACEPCAATATQHPARTGWNGALRQSERRIDWQADATAQVLRKLLAGDGAPGVEDELCGLQVRLFDAAAEHELRGAPGELIARSADAVCRATRDGAVWIGRLKAATGAGLKLPATQVLGDRIADLPRAPALADAHGVADARERIRYVERGPVGYLYFDFYNGAMSSLCCERLRIAYERARTRPTRVIALMGGDEFWSNGLDLNAIEAAASPADESWRNINAMNDLAREIITTESHLTIAAIRGNAGAGGVFLALAADAVYAREGVVLNPHYMNMGNLYGSEYWTYLLPRRVGEGGIAQVMANRLPLRAQDAVRMGLVDGVLPANGCECSARVDELADDLAAAPGFNQRLDAKRARRAADEAAKPLAAYRAQELEQMKLNFYGFDPSYHVARYKFVHRVPQAWTPVHLARHRQLAWRRKTMGESNTAEGL